MKKIKENILSWCNEPEQGAIDQAINISKHPWLVGNVALMSDTHQGYGMPIGGVVCLEDAVCPNMVGVDIGCGMLAVKTSMTDITQEQIKDLFSYLRGNIPLGMSRHREKKDHWLFDEVDSFIVPVCHKHLKTAQESLGTLGGGNHFIELQKGDDGYIWFMIHSGSRNLGKQVAEYYNEKAKRLCKMFKLDKIVQDDLAILPKGSEHFETYLDELDFCLHFALANREEMSNVIKFYMQLLFGCTFEEPINIHHNYVTLENHYGKNVYIHRKGATLARENTIGIIPGSQGTCSYIVKGKGNKASMDSCSHGAGRKMSRNKAVENLVLEEEIAKLDGIVHSIRGKQDLEEASSAYKDIDVVMEEQKDLVDILVKLTPLGVIKG